jgi:hypothetical protein
MYRCDECGEATKKCQKLLKQIVYRLVTHKEGTVGPQIAREIKLCPVCMHNQPDVG